MTMKQAVLIACLALNAYAQFTMQEAKSIAACTLTVEKMTRLYQATIELNKLAASDPEVNRQLRSGSQQGLEAQIHNLESNAKAVAIIRSHGLSVRDYSLTTLAINMALLPMAKIPEASRPRDWRDDPYYASIPPEHMQFVAEHAAEIKKYRDQVIAIQRAARGK